jgi:SAM-dependent methyltransferase
MDRSAPTSPKCPITGLPAMRHIQNIPSPLLIALWRISFGVRAARQLSGVRRFGLWEAPCGLAFFDPMIAGDKAFYDDLYRRLGEEGLWSGRVVERSDYSRIAALVQPGQSVLDVGCGSAGFARYLPLASYVGLEQSVEARKVAADVRGETVAEHAERHAGAYDVVCACHVIEHIAEPAPFIAAMARCLRADGRLAIVAPSWPGAMTDIPNFVMNGPPHHLTWWTERALHELAKTSGLLVESVEALPPSPVFSILYWMGWAAPKLTGGRFFRHASAWYLALLWSWLAGRLCNALFRLPAHAHRFELLLVARKPG